jgi:mRNA interferase RelE/StbE
MYKILYKKTVEKELRKIPKSTLTFIISKIQKLSENPRPISSVKLRGATNIYRIRCSDYRIIYSINDSKIVVFVVKVAHRKEVYRDY